MTPPTHTPTRVRTYTHTYTHTRARACARTHGTPDSRPKGQVSAQARFPKPPCTGEPTPQPTPRALPPGPAGPRASAHAHMARALPPSRPRRPQGIHPRPPGTRPPVRAGAVCGQMNGAAITPADYSVLVKGLPRNVTKEDLVRVWAGSHHAASMCAIISRWAARCCRAPLLNCWEGAGLVASSLPLVAR